MQIMLLQNCIKAHIPSRESGGWSPPEAEAF